MTESVESSLEREVTNHKIDGDYAPRHQQREIWSANLLLADYFLHTEPQSALASIKT
jgi:hypothetical protein